MTSLTDVSLRRLPYGIPGINRGFFDEGFGACEIFETIEASEPQSKIYCSEMGK